MSETVLFPDRLKSLAETSPNAPALRYNDRTQTYGELAIAIERSGAALASTGLQPGDRVALCAGNSLDYVAVVLGAACSGLSFVPLPTRIQPTDCAQMIADADCRAIFTDAATQELTDAVLCAGCSIDGDKKIGIDFSAEGWASWLQMTADAPSGRRAADIKPETEFNIIYTSGTTGVPKGIRHDHHYRATGSANMAAYAGFNDQSVSVLPTSLYGNWGLFGVFASLWGGGLSVIFDRFGIDEFSELGKKSPPTHYFFVPAQIRKLLKDPRFDIARHDGAALKFSAGSPLSVDLKKEVVERWPGGLVDIYGMTEGAPSAILFVDEHLDKLESVGSVFGSDAEIFAIDEEGNRLSPGTVGEIVGRNTTMTEGYLNKPDATKALFWYDKDGKKFIRSGDMGYVDDDGFLYITDRIKDLIITGGFNVFPIDIETVIMRHTDVDDATVIGVADDRWGETPVAYVVRREGAGASLDDIREWANARLGKVQRISAIFEIDALPRNHMGKVLKAEIKKTHKERVPASAMR